LNAVANAPGRILAILGCTLVKSTISIARANKCQVVIAEQAKKHNEPSALFLVLFQKLSHNYALEFSLSERLQDPSSKLVILLGLFCILGDFGGSLFLY
jgi:hypothetical protein